MKCRSCGARETRGFNRREKIQKMPNPRMNMSGKTISSMMLSRCYSQVCVVHTRGSKGVSLHTPQTLMPFHTEIMMVGTSSSHFRTLRDWHVGHAWGCTDIIRFIPHSTHVTYAGHARGGKGVWSVIQCQVPRTRDSILVSTFMRLLCANCTWYSQR